MWFKNLQVFCFTKAFGLTAEQLEEALSQHEFKPCESQSASSMGWVQPLSNSSEMLVHSANGRMMICVKRQEKILPAGVINDRLDEKARALEFQESRRLTRKERQDMKEEIRFELLPKAFCRSSLQYAYIDALAGIMVIDSTSIKKAEEMITLLRESLGSLPVVPMTTKTVPLHSMTHWLLNQAPPEGFTFGDTCDLKELQDDGGSVSLKHQDLLSDETQSHLKAGMSVTKLELSNDALRFVVDENLSIKCLKFSDMIQERADNEDAESAAEQFDIDFVIMAGELEKMIGQLVAAFGGRDTSTDEKLKEQMAKVGDSDH